MQPEEKNTVEMTMVEEEEEGVSHLVSWAYWPRILRRCSFTESISTAVRVDTFE